MPIWSTDAYTTGRSWPSEIATARTSIGSLTPFAGPWPLSAQMPSQRPFPFASQYTFGAPLGFESAYGSWSAHAPGCGNSGCGHSSELGPNAAEPGAPGTGVVSSTDAPARKLSARAPAGAASNAAA